MFVRLGVRVAFPAVEKKLLLRHYFFYRNLSVSHVSQFFLSAMICGYCCCFNFALSF